MCHVKIYQSFKGLKKSGQRTLTQENGTICLDSNVIPQVAQAWYESLYGKNRVWNLDEINEVKAIKVINKV